MMTTPILLPHEHVFSRYRASDRQAAKTFIRSALDEASSAGITDIVDLTAYVNPTGYLPLIEDSPVRVHACVGFYLDRMVRRDVREKGVASLTRLLLDRHRRYSKQMSVVGIKVAARHAGLSDFEDRAFQSVAAAHRETGLPVITHSSDGALAHQRRLIDLGVDPSRILLSHPELNLKGRTKKPYAMVIDDVSEIVSSGSSICVTDLYSPTSTADTGAIALVKDLVQLGHTDRILLSGDMSWRVRRGVGGFHGVSANADLGFRLALHSVQKLRATGVPQSSVEQIIHSNPFRFYGISR